MVILQTARDQAEQAFMFGSVGLALALCALFAILIAAGLRR